MGKFYPNYLKKEGKLYNNDNILLLKKFVDVKQKMVSAEFKEVEEYQKQYKQLMGEIINNNILLVKSIVKLYVCKGISYNDLFQEGIIGLSIAIDKFDIEKGNSFSTYATIWIHQALKRLIIDNKNIIKMSPSLYYLKIKVNVINNRYQLLFNRKPTIEELAQELNINLNTLKKDLSFYKEYISLDSYLMDNTRENRSYLVKDAVRGSFDIEESYFQKELNTNINILLNQLPTCEEKFIRMYYGISKDENPQYARPHSFREIAQEYNVSIELVRQIIKRAQNIILSFSNISLLDGYYNKKSISSFWDLLYDSDSNNKLMKFNTLSIAEQNILFQSFGNNLDSITSSYKENETQIKSIVYYLNNKSIKEKSSFLWEKLKCDQSILNYLINTEDVIKDIKLFFQNYYGTDLNQSFNELLIPLGKKEEFLKNEKILQQWIMIVKKILCLKLNKYEDLQLDNLIKLVPTKYRRILLIHFGLQTKYYKKESLPLEILDDGIKYLDNINKLYNKIYNKENKLIRTK